MTSTVERKRRPGVKPRAGYLESSISRNRPWEGEGMSRISWYRLRRQIEWHQRQAGFNRG